MKNKISWQLTAVLIGFACATPLWAAEPASDVKIVINHNDQDQASASFKFKNVPKPSSSDAASNLKFSVLTGDPDSFSGGVIKLNDGKLPSEEDEPGENFFFNAGTDGGRLLLDLGKTINVAQINTYSWHSDSRAPQVYDLYASDGTDADFSASPSKGIDPAKRGWKLIAKVNTRSEFGKSGGQYAERRHVRAFAIRHQDVQSLWNPVTAVHPEWFQEQERGRKKRRTGGRRECPPSGCRPRQGQPVDGNDSEYIKHRGVQMIRVCD